MAKRLFRAAVALGLAAVAAPVVAQAPVAAPAPGMAQRLVNALGALRPAVQVEGRSYAPASIEELMARHKVPAVSIAVIDDGRIVWAKAYGLADAAANRPVTPDTLFQAASISKPVAATAALAMVEAGQLKLNAPINDQLKSWRIPDGEAAPGSAVTLRHLLTHTGGLTVHGFGGYEAGKPLPSIVQILNGEPPANSEAVRITAKPGAEWRYSGGGFTVLQLAMTDAAGSGFPELMDRLVLQPLQMERSSYRQPPGTDMAADAAVGHRGDGTAVPGRFHIYPEMAAAGLWTTPTDLARWVAALSAASAGEPGGVLRQETARAMLTKGTGDWGLGLYVRGQDQTLRFSHDGANEGFRSLMIGYPGRREGLVIMANGDAAGVLFGAINLAVGEAMGWADVRPRMITPAAISERDRLAIVGRYESGPIVVDVRQQGDRIIANQSGTSFEFIPIGPDTFVAPDIGIRVQFTRDSKSGRVTGLSTGGAELKKTR